jgi:hypothetical protein
MKKSSSKPTRASAGKNLETNCDGSPPYPPNPPTTGTIPGKDELEFVYYGNNDLAKGFNDGQLVQHTMKLSDGEQAYVFSLRGGPHKRRTLSKLDIKALLGPCTVVIQNGATTTLQTGDSMNIPAGSTFSFQTDAKAVMLGRSLTGPGLGNPWGDPEP